MPRTEDTRKIRGISQHQRDLGHLAEGHLARRIHDPDVIQKRIGE